MSKLALEDGGGARDRAGMVRGLSGEVGDKFEFLLDSVITTGIVTKRHFDNCTGQELNIAVSMAITCNSEALIIMSPPTDMFLQRCLGLRALWHQRREGG